jgi:hypothetical protein
MPGTPHSQAVRDKTFELHAQGLSALAISKKIGNISSTTVLRWLKGITPPIKEDQIIDDLEDQVFTKLTVKKLGIKPKEVKSRGAWWWCECSCKKVCVLVPAKGLKRGFNKSCGCNRLEKLSERRNFYTRETREKALQLRVAGKSFREIDKELGNLARGTVRRWFIPGTNELRKFREKEDRSGQFIGLLSVDSIIQWDDLPPEEKPNFRKDRIKTRRGRNYTNEIMHIYQCTCTSCKRKCYRTWDGLYTIKKKLIDKTSRFRGCIWCDLGEGTINYLEEPYNGIVSGWQVIKWRKVENTMPSVKSETLLEWFCHCKICDKTERWIRASQLNNISRGVNINKTGLVGCGCNTDPYKADREKYGSFAVKYFHEKKSDAAEQGIPFNLDPSDFANIPKTCPVLGIPLVPRDENMSGRPIDNSPSLDKFYPELGYVKGNVHFVSYRANRLKNDGTPEEWDKIAKWSKQEDVRMRLEGKHPYQKKK